MKMQTKWDLSQLYKSPNDPKLMADVVRIEKAYKKFAAKYSKDKKYLSNPSRLQEALVEYEALMLLPDPSFYLAILKDIESTNKEAEAMGNKVSQLLTASSNQLIFFTLSLGKIVKEKQKTFLNNKILYRFKYFLQNIFLASAHDLSESEEKILNLFSLPSYGMWVDGQEKLLSSQEISFEGKMLPIAEALNTVKDLPVEKRRALWKSITHVLKQISSFAESELNAIVTRKKISDKLRGHSKPYSATVLGYQNNEKSVENLVVSVSKAFPIAHRFYEIKKNMLGVKELTYADRNADVGKTNKKISFEQGLAIVRSAFSKVGKHYVDILDSFLENGQIDVFPAKGKRGGAYCWGTVTTPTYVLLNYTESLDSVSTFAHEMGHAIHTESSKVQDTLYKDYTISVAEVASTFFENFAFEEVFATLSEEEKIVALHDHINDDVQTIFRQIALFNFEKEFHATIREKGSLVKEEIALLMNKHMKSYLGPAMHLEDDDGYFFVAWSHIRRFFYVYSYAYGQIISRALYKKYKEDTTYIKKIEEFLKAGGSKSPEQIFKDIGIDTSKPSFFEAGLKSIEEDITRLEKMVKSAKTKK